MRTESDLLGSKEKLAVEIGCSVSAIEKWRYGIATMSADKYIKIMRIIEVNKDE